MVPYNAFGFDSIPSTPKRSPRPEVREEDVTPGKYGKRSAGKGKGSSPGLYGDRFIPQRSAMNLDISHFELTRGGGTSSNMENANVNASPAKEEYKKELAQTLMQTPASNKVSASASGLPGGPCAARRRPPRSHAYGSRRQRPPRLASPARTILLLCCGVTGTCIPSCPLAWQVLAFQNKAPRTALERECSLRVLYTQNREAGLLPRKYSRHIPQAPERILDAPELLDDYYLNLLDWSSTNVLGVALGDSIYLWNASDGSIQQLMQAQGEQSHVTSLAWIGEVREAALDFSAREVPCTPRRAPHPIRAPSPPSRAPSTQHGKGRRTPPIVHLPPLRVGRTHLT